MAQDDVKAADAKDKADDAKADTKSDDKAAQSGAITIEELKTIINDAVEAKTAELGKQTTANFEGLARAMLPAQPKAPPQKGVQFVRYVKMMWRAKGIGRIAAEYAEQIYGPEGAELAKALGTQIGESGGFVVPEQYSTDIIELLRNKTVVRRSGVPAVPMAGSMQVPRLDVGSTSGYVGENRPITPSEPKMGQLRMTSRKLAGLVPMSNDWLRLATPQGDQLVLNDLTTGMAVTEDLYFLFGAGTENAPKGLRYWTHTDNVSASAGATVDNIRDDLRGCVNNLDNANIPMTNPVWFMAPRSRNYLYDLRESAGGNLLYPELQKVDDNAPSGRLWTYPVWVTNQIPINEGGGSNESQIALCDVAQCVIGEELTIEVAMSDSASYDTSGTVTSAFQNDQTVIRAIAKHDFAMRHDKAAAWRTGVTWGA